MKIGRHKRVIIAFGFLVMVLIALLSYFQTAKADGTAISYGTIETDGVEYQDMSVTAHDEELEPPELTLDGLLEITSDATSLQPGDTVDVNLYIHNWNVAGFDGIIDYDTDVFEELGQGDITMNDKLLSWDLIYNPSERYINVSQNSYRASVVPEDEYFISLHFKVKNGSASTKISFKNYIVTDSQFNDTYLMERPDLSITIYDQENVQPSTGDLAPELTWDGLLELTSDATSFNQGDTIDVELYIHNWNVAYFSGNLRYDEDIFEEITLSNITLDERMKSWNPAYDLTEKYLTVSQRSIDASLIPEDGLFAKFKFVVKKDFELTTIYIDNPYVCDNDFNDLVLAQAPEISITISNENGNSQTGGNLALSVSDADIQAGQEITLPIDITRNPGINALGLLIQYDEDVCAYNGLEVADVFSHKVTLKDDNAMDGDIRAAFLFAGDIVDIGTLANLKFTVGEDVQPGDTMVVNVTILEVTNKSETEVAGTGASGTLTVRSNDVEPDDYILGDVNLDGKIGLADAVYVLESYNEERTLSEKQKRAGDVNQDSEVNLVDALLIMQYFTGKVSGF